QASAGRPSTPRQHAPPVPAVAGDSKGGLRISTQSPAPFKRRPEPTTQPPQHDVASSPISSVADDIRSPIAAISSATSPGTHTHLPDVANKVPDTMTVSQTEVSVEQPSKEVAPSDPGAQLRMEVEQAVKASTPSEE